MASHRNLDKDYTKRTQDYNSYTLSPSKSKSKPKHLQKTKLNLSPINRTPKQTRELKMNLENYKKSLSEQWEELPPIFVTSSETGVGREEVLDYIESLNNNKEL